MVDPEAAGKRVLARAERVATGLDELDQWLTDQVRGGLAGLERLGYSHFDGIAARMVDAQAPGVAGLLRAIPGEFAREGWPERVLEQLAALHLLVQAHRRLAELDDELAATVRSRVGYPVRKDAVLDTPGVADHWFAVGQVDTVEYRLETRRVWLFGATTRRWALLLSFAPPGGVLDSSVRAGQLVAGRLHFYPGSGQYRALLGVQTSAVDPPVSPPAESCDEVRRRFAKLLGLDPWSSRMPAVVRGTPLVPPRMDAGWALRDEAGRVCAVVGSTGEPWPVVARSTGDPVDVFGEWGPAGFRPLSLPADDQGRPFTTSVFADAA
jgi:hypothetical protein